MIIFAPERAFGCGRQICRAYTHTNIHTIHIHKTYIQNGYTVLFVVEGSISQQARTALTANMNFAFITHSLSTYPNDSPEIDDARLARKKRRRTSPEDLAVLEEEYQKCEKPTRQMRLCIANRVNMEERAVQVRVQQAPESLLTDRFGSKTNASKGNDQHRQSRVWP